MSTTTLDPLDLTLYGVRSQNANDFGIPGYLRLIMKGLKAKLDVI